MSNVSSRVETLNFLLNNRLFKRPEEIALRIGRDTFYVVNEDYELAYMSTFLGDHKYDSYIPETPCKCYEKIAGRTSPCENCVIYNHDKNATACWLVGSEEEGDLNLIRSHFCKDKQKSYYSNIKTKMGDVSESIRHMQRIISSRELVSKCLSIISDESYDESEKFCEILKNTATFYEASSAYAVLFGERPRSYTYNFPDDPEAKISADEFPQYIRDKMERLMTPYSVCYFENIAEVKDSDPKVYAHFNRWGIKAFVLAPIFMGSEITGIVVLHNIHLNQRDIPAFCTIANLLATLDFNLSSRLKQIRLINNDSLTGALNFEAFKNQAKSTLTSNLEKQFALCSIDIKDFKNINDLFGYDAGDNLLRFWAKAAVAARTENELVCRVQADTMCYLLEYDGEAGLNSFFNQLVDRLRSYVHENISNVLNVEVAAGVYIINENDTHTLNEMFNRAHIARMMIKALPGSQISIYSKALHDERRFAKELEMYLPDALSHERIVPFFQPQLVISERAKKKGKVRAEALARWVNEDGTIFASPDKFIPICERNGQIAEVDHSIFRSVCETIKKLKEKGVDACISVNVSRYTLFRPGFVEYYESVRKEYDVPYSNIVLEFTESIFIKDTEKFSEIIAKLEALGFICSMDDFGSDYSSLGLLHLLDLHELKLDRAFFLPDGNTGKKQVIINNILKLSDDLNMESVAEGVETKEMIEELKENNCDYVQGYAYAKPMPVDRFFEWVENEK